MWISKKEYNELIRSRDFWKREHNSESTYRLSLLRDYDCALTSNDKLRSENDDLQAQVEEYKQKYADEVQKRLELVKLLENTHLTNQ